jgi:hypothetical protein
VFVRVISLIVKDVDGHTGTTYVAALHDKRLPWISGSFVSFCEPADSGIVNWSLADAANGDLHNRTVLGSATKMRKIRPPF